MPNYMNILREARPERVTAEALQQYDLSHAGLGTTWLRSWGMDHGVPFALKCEAIGVKRHMSRPRMTVLMLVSPKGEKVLYGQSVDWSNAGALVFSDGGITLHDHDGNEVETDVETPENMGDLPYVMAKWIRERPDTLAYLVERFQVKLPEQPFRWMATARPPVVATEPITLADGRVVNPPPDPDDREVHPHFIILPAGRGRRERYIPARHGDAFRLQDGTWTVGLCADVMPADQVAAVNTAVRAGHGWTPGDQLPQRLNIMGPRGFARGQWLLVALAHVPTSVALYHGRTS